MPDIACPADPDDEAFDRAMDALRRLDRRQRMPNLEFIAFWCELPAERRAAIVKVVRPEMSDVGVARLVGVSRSELVQSEIYDRSKRKLADFRHIRFRSSKRRANRSGGWYDMDNPDA